MNPFNSDIARANSSYAAFRDNKLVSMFNTDVAPPPLVQLVHDSFRALVLSPGFSCVGAKAAIQNGDYRFGVYATMGAAGTTLGLARDLFAFVEEQKTLDSDFTTFIASFVEPSGITEADFEHYLWDQLQSLHDRDCRYHHWDASVASDPDHARFSFSFAGRAFFVVGLSPASSRWARRFAWPTLIFNAHAQFDHLREAGKYRALQKAIRARECALQGHINPVLSDFGDVSEARQYSGRSVGSQWKCPFKAHRRARRTGTARQSRHVGSVCPSRGIILKDIARYHLEPQTGTAFILEKGQVLRVIDPEGEQVADLTAFAQADTGEWLSSGRSFDYNNTIYLTTGHVLYSSKSSRMFTILEDKVGKHDFLYTPCSPEMFRIIYKYDGDHPSCFENLAKNLARFGIAEDTIPTTFNIFMNVDVSADGALKLRPPLSRPGDFIALRAELNMIVAVTACSAEMSNNGRLKPIELEVVNAAKHDKPGSDRNKRTM